MEPSKIKVRVNLNTREFEVEGDQEVVFKNFGDLMKDYLNAIKKDTKPLNSTENKVTNETKSPNTNFTNELAIGNLPDNFGEFYHKFPKTLSNVDKLLLAGFFIQNNSESKLFTIKEAKDLLVNQGIKLSNPNAFNKSNLSTKRVFKTSGKNYRVSDIGIESVRSMMQFQ